MHFMRNMDLRRAAMGLSWFRNNLDRVEGAVKNSPDRKIAQTVRSERFFGIINYATK